MTAPQAPPLGRQESGRQQSDSQASSSREPRIGPVLVTGARGFLGATICQALAVTGEAVIAADLHEAGSPDSQRDGAPALGGSIRHVVADILDLPALDSLVTSHGIRAIVHLAGLVIPVCRDNPVRGAEVNILGQLHVLELARRHDIRRLVYMSSVAARPRPPLDSPVNLYGAYKRCGEDIAKVWFLDHGIASIGLRPNVVYGPGRESGETAAITLAMKAAATGEAYRIPWSGALCFQHIDEVVGIVLKCLSVTPEHPVVSDLTTRVETIGDVIDCIRRFVPEARIDAADVQRPAPPTLDNAPLQQLIGDWHGVSLLDGTRRTLLAYGARLPADIPP